MSRISLVMGVVTSFVWLAILSDLIYILVSGRGYKYLGLDLFTLLVFPIVPFGYFYLGRYLRRQ